MKLVYVTSSMGLHVMAISDAYFKHLGSDFTFVWTKRPSDAEYGIHKHAEIGFKYDRSYILNAWESQEKKIEAIDKINNADVVICGGKSHDYIRQRLKDRKLTFNSSERWFKHRFNIVPPRSILNIIRNLILPQNNNYYQLALSAYCANDAAFIRSFKNRVYKFGYFVPIENYDVKECLRSKRREVVEIMWCARFIYWKHPELVIELAERLLSNGYNKFHINMVGANSPLQDSIKLYIKNNKLDDFITIIEGLPNSETRSLMKRCNIFLITSDRQEGWGAVLNEAMGAGCGIVASNQIGSTPFLLKQMQNGLIFKSGSLDSLYSSVVRLYSDEYLRETLAENAYRTISEEWSVDSAAIRFLKLCDSILKGDLIHYSDGPCALAQKCDENKILYF